MGTTEAPDTTGHELRERIAEAAARLRVPGVAVGICRGDEVDLAYHGVTSVWNRLPVDEATFFQIGSTAKVYTGTGVMVLVDRGLVELEAPVRRYLPELSLRDEQAAESVTVLNLLNHTAGWSGDYFPDTGYGDDALARYMEGVADLEQIFPPGAMVSYNNTSLCVAGRLIEKVTGMTYEAAMRELVFEPLGLGEHLFFPWEVMRHRYVAPHVVEGQDYRMGLLHEPRCLHPAGGEISTTLRDLVAFGRFHAGDGQTADGKRLLAPDTIERMRIPTADGLDSVEDRVGISWMLRAAPDVRILEHGGNTVGQNAELLVVPERDFVLAVLTNSTTGRNLIEELRSWALDAYLGITIPEPQPLDLAPEQLDEYAGTYEESTQTLTLAREVDCLVGELVVHPDLEMGEFMEEMADHFAEPWPVSFRAFPGDRLMATDGPLEGNQAIAVRNSEGQVTGLIVAGRLLRRRE